MRNLKHAHRKGGHLLRQNGFFTTMALSTKNSQKATPVIKKKKSRSQCDNNKFHTQLAYQLCYGGNDPKALSLSNIASKINWPITGHIQDIFRSIYTLQNALDNYTNNKIKSIDEMYAFQSAKSTCPTTPIAFKNPSIEQFINLLLEFDKLVLKALMLKKYGFYTKKEWDHQIKPITAKWRELFKSIQQNK